MRLRLFLLLCIGVSTIANARPGDDIWDNIRDLYALVGTANTGVNQVSGDLTSLRTLFDSTVAEIQKLSQEVTSLRSDAPLPHYIGEKYHGGIVFYVDETKQHGLIAGLIDANTEGVQWRNGASGNKITNARGDGIGAGEANTRIIIAQETADNQKGLFAALLASNFQVIEDGVTQCKTPIAADTVCYGGWYLPSAYELQLMRNSLYQGNLSSFASEFYWSSTEDTVNRVWVEDFGSGKLSLKLKSENQGSVRAISKF